MQKEAADAPRPHMMSNQNYGPERYRATSTTAGAHAGLRLKLLEFCGRTDDVADPWYTGDFETTYRDVFDGRAGLLENLLERNA